MKYILSLYLCLLSLNAVASDKESLLAAWETMQKNHAEVAQFEKLENRKYQVKFNTLPFEGELRVLAYDTESLAYQGLTEDQYSLSGYIEVELIDAPDDMLMKYNRTYHKWAESNYLYFNNNSGTWVTGREYSDSLQTEINEDVGFWFWVAEYSWLILAGLFIYIVYTLAFGNRHLKTSIEQQKQALDDMEYTKKHMEEALELNRESNRLLSQILKALNNKKD